MKTISLLPVALLAWLPASAAQAQAFGSSADGPFEWSASKLPAPAADRGRASAGSDLGRFSILPRTNSDPLARARSLPTPAPLVRLRFERSILPLAAARPAYRYVDLGKGEEVQTQQRVLNRIVLRF